MVTKTAEIAWPDIGAEEFFAVVDLIIHRTQQQDEQGGTHRLSEL